jgi:hypothetical protein
MMSLYNNNTLSKILIECYTVGEDDDDDDDLSGEENETESEEEEMSDE